MRNNLFTPLTLRGITFKNRIFVSPMCQYSSQDGMPTTWHMVHLGSRAVGGAGCIIQEATAVTADGRISPEDAGLWNEAQMEAYKPIVQFIKANGAVPGIQLAHAGRKASTYAPWRGNGKVDPDKGGWEVMAPSAVAFDKNYPTPRAMTEKEIQEIITAFVKAAQRSLMAGFEVIELHAAHGYLMHEFLSPLANRRTDNYGGTLENRMRLVLEVATAVRKVWPEHLPLFVRLSASDWVEGGWDVAQSVTLCGKLKEIGVDLIDASSGGMTPDARIPAGPGYQVPFADAIRQGTQMPVGAVGKITNAEQAEQIIATHQADVVLLAREMLRDPYWPLHAAQALGEESVWPSQYERAKSK